MTSSFATAAAPQSPHHRLHRKILVVTGDLPSHPYACAKLATVLASDGGHEVTVAGPNGPALSRLRTETERYNESATSDANEIRCASIGDVSTAGHINVRRVVDPRDCSPLRLVLDAILAAFGSKYVRYGLANDLEQVMDDQVGTYDNLRRMIPEYDLVYAIHTAAGTVCDAVESLRREKNAKRVPPVIVFSSLPYNSGFFCKNSWATPRSIVALPHVATYSLPSEAFKESRFFLVGLARYLVRIFWMRLDAYHAERAWRIAARRADARRARRGLPPTGDGARYYWTNYPVLALGGTHPYIAEGEPVAHNATVVGSIRSATAGASDLTRLEDWFARARVERIVYASFGTGTQLDEEEATNLAGLAISLSNTERRLLLSLSSDSQKRLRRVFDDAMGSEPTRVGEGFFEYDDGKFRIDCDVPQENLLLSGLDEDDDDDAPRPRADLFVSHLGFGAYAEAVRGGVPLVAYPAGCDQWYNAERAVGAGISVRAKTKMRDLDSTVRDALHDVEMRGRSRRLALNAANSDGNEIILDMADRICEGGT